MYIYYRFFFFQRFIYGLRRFYKKINNQLFIINLLKKTDIYINRASVKLCLVLVFIDRNGETFCISSKQLPFSRSI